MGNTGSGGVPMDSGSSRRQPRPFNDRVPFLIEYRVAEVSVFHACNFSCGYCNFATSGLVADSGDMAPFKDKAYIDKVFDFFEKNSTADRKWILHLTGGEPLLMPNADYFSERFISAGHKLAFNTNLAIPIESNGWMERNPPSGVSAIIVSLHQQALDQFETIFARVRVLKRAGYRLYIRMVAHPQFIPRFKELDDKFKSIDVTFSVNPLYSPRYPRAYSENEREEILKHTKLHYEAIRLDGGLNMRGRKCLAGDKLISVGLGVSGGGNVYPCISTSTNTHLLGNIFDDTVRLREGEHACLRADQCCSCAIHFTHGIIPTVDDHPAHERALEGYTESVAGDWKEWLATRGVKTTFHEGTPQGTARGESELVVDARKIFRGKSKELQPTRFHRISDVAAPRYTAWRSESSTVESHATSEEALEFVSKPTRGQMLMHSPVMSLGPGRYQVDCDVRLRKGGIAFGVLDTKSDAWVAQTTRTNSGTMRLHFSVPIGGYRAELVFSAFNWVGKGGITDASCRPVEVRRVADPTAYYRDNMKRFGDDRVREWRTVSKACASHLRLGYLACRGRIVRSVPAALRFGRSYQVTDSQEAGYACRSIVGLTDKKGRLRLVTANTGHDSLSVIDLREGKMLPPKTIQFSKQSTPIYLSTLSADDGTTHVVASLFNFDETGELQEKSYLTALSDLDGLAEKDVVDIEKDTNVLLSRPGFWGFRGSAVSQEGQGPFRLAAVDRDLSEFHILQGAARGGRIEVDAAKLDLGAGSEPIGIGQAPDPLRNDRPIYYLSLRNTEEVICVGLGDDGKAAIRHRIGLNGLSRSSVAVGRFHDSDQDSVAVALWGGPPTDLLTPHRGKVAVGRIDPTGNLQDITYLDAGIHPTDIAAGDIDGDGRDELVVLNYGTGLTHQDRGHLGGVDIFKATGTSGWRRVASLPLANPRIATIADIDGDGIAELLVSLFFENRIVTIKFV